MTLSLLHYLAAKYFLLLCSLFPTIDVTAMQRKTMKKTKRKMEKTNHKM